MKSLAVTPMPNNREAEAPGAGRRCTAYLGVAAAVDSVTLKREVLIRPN